MLRGTLTGVVAGLAVCLIAVLITAADARAAARAGSATAWGGRLLLQQSGARSAVAAELLRSDIRLVATGPIVRTVVIQQFRNPQQSWSEAVYAYRLPAGAAADAFGFEHGSRAAASRIAPLPPGESAAASDAALANAFSASVGTVAPGEAITVRLEYQELVDFADSAYTLRVPLNGEGPVALNITLDPGFTPAHVQASSADASITRGEDGTLHVALETSGARTGEDFTLRWAPEPAHAPQLSLHRERVGERDYVLAVLTPPAIAEAQQRPAREVVYVVDTSGSMAGTPIEQVKAALRSALSRLQPNDRFNVIGFADATEALFAQPQAASPEAVGRAREFLDSLHAGGGSKLLPALAFALADATPSLATPRQVVVLSDGAISDEAAIFAHVAARRGRSRLFAIGIGALPDRFFMRRLTELGRGAYVHVDTADRILEATQSLLAMIERPVVNDVRVQWSPGVRAEAWPDPMPDLYAGHPVVIIAELASARGELTLSGTFDGAAWQTSVPLAEARAGSGIAKAWARRKLASLHARRWLGQDAAVIDAAVEQVAVEHQILSSMTGLYVVESGSPFAAGSIARPLRLYMPPGLVYAGERGKLGSATAGVLRAPDAGEPAGGRSGQEFLTGNVEAVPSAAAEAPHAGLAGMLTSRVLLVAAMALFFAAMCAVTVGFWRHLSREEVPARRPRRGV